MCTQIPRQISAKLVTMYIFHTSWVQFLKANPTQILFIHSLAHKNTVNICGGVLWSDLRDHAVLASTQTQILKFPSSYKQIYFWPTIIRNQIVFFTIQVYTCTGLRYSKPELCVCAVVGLSEATSSGCRRKCVSWVLAIAGNGSGIFSFGGVYVLH